MTTSSIVKPVFKFKDNIDMNAFMRILPMDRLSYTCDSWELEQFLHQWAPFAHKNKKVRRLNPAETEKSAFIKATQSTADNFNFYPSALSYNINNDYSFSYQAGLDFIDRRGVSSNALKY